MGEDNALKAVKVKYTDDEEVIEVSASNLDQLVNYLEATVSILTSKGLSYTLSGSFNLSNDLNTNFNELFATSGLRRSSFIMVHGKEKVNKEAKIEELYKSDIGLNFFAVEGYGTPSKWRRFDGPNGDNTWHNSGSSYDRIVFVPQKDIAFAGFSTFAAKTDPKYFIKYKIDIDGVVIIDQNQPVE